jgi:hypothetical protein
MARSGRDQAGPARGRWLPAVALAGLGLLVSACGAPDYHYVSTGDHDTFFKVPHAWRLYDEKQIF